MRSLAIARVFYQRPGDRVARGGAGLDSTCMAEPLQGGRLAARAIAAQGVDVLFTLSGGHVMPIYEGCRHEGVRVVDVRHEQSAAHAAEAWGRVRRTAGVALVTAGPGVTGTVTAVASCHAAQSPLVVVGGARPLAQTERGALQELDQLSLMKTITKWAATCPSTARIPEYVAIAFRHALAQPRGPVYLELPADVLFGEAPSEGDVSPRRAAPRAFGDPDELAKAAELLSGAERPAVVAGSGVWWDDAASQLAALVGNGRLPVFLNGSGRGSIPPGHDLLFRHARSTALEEADVVCVVGTPLDFRLRFGRFAAGTLVHVHSDPRELGRNRVPDAAIVGDTASVLGALAEAIRAPRDGRADWLEQLRRAEAAWWEDHRAEIESERVPIHHYRFAAELGRVLEPGTVVIGDGGDVVAAVSRVVDVHRPGHWLDPGPFGCLGVGPGYALGVGAAGFGERIVCVLGDGAFGLNGMDFDTLVRFGIPAVLVVGNDAAWGEVRVPQVGIYGAEGELATTLAPSHYDRLTEVFGGYGEHVERPEDVAPALERALASGEPSIVDVALDPDAMAGHAYRGF
jgi:acetolactate synthase-1/2/3 large subunit